MEGYVGDEQELVDRQNRCPDCGRNLEALGEYRDYVHYIPGTDYPCQPRSPLADKIVESMCDRANATISSLLGID